MEHQKKKPGFWQWLMGITVVTLIIAAVYLKQQNDHLVKENRHLILQNDSVLSVNLEMGKNIAAMRQLLDSLQPIALQKQPFAGKWDGR
jgi:hypothetical protein